MFRMTRKERDLYFAARKGDNHVVKMLLEENVKIVPDMGYCTALTGSCYNGHENVVRLLLDYGLSVELFHRADINGWTPLVCAAATGHLGIVKLLLQHNPPAKIFNHTKDGETALSLAEKRGMFHVVEHLSSEAKKELIKGMEISGFEEMLPKDLTLLIVSFVV